MTLFPSSFSSSSRPFVIFIALLGFTQGQSPPLCDETTGISLGPDTLDIGYIFQEGSSSNTLEIQASIAAQEPTWFGIGFSQTGNMVPGRAVVGEFLEDGNVQGSVRQFDLFDYSLTVEEAVRPLPLDPSDADVATVVPFDTTATSISFNQTHVNLRFVISNLDQWMNFLPTSPDAIATSIHTMWAHGRSGQGSVAYHGGGNRGRTAVPLQLLACRQASGDSMAPTVSAAPTSLTSSSPSLAPSISQFPTMFPTATTCATMLRVENQVYQQTVILQPDVLFLQYNVFVDANVLQVRLTYLGVGWVGWGIAAPTSPQSMIPGESVIGIPDGVRTEGGSVQKYIMSDRNLAGVTASPRQTLMNTRIFQNRTHTIMDFTKLFVEDEETPILISEEDEGTDAAASQAVNNFLWAYGRSNQLAVHARFGAFPLVLRPCDANNAQQPPATAASSSFVDTESLWMAHGILAGLAWGVLSPIAIGASLLRNYIMVDGRPGFWFQLHYYLNMSVLVFTLLAFIIAIAAFERRGGPRTHFDISHGKVGLTVVIVVSFQVLGGIFRVQKKTKKDDIDQENGQGANIVDHGKPWQRLVWEIAHRSVGIIVFGLAMWQIVTGFSLWTELFQYSDYRPIFYGITGSIVGITLILYVYDKFFRY